MADNNTYLNSWLSDNPDISTRFFEDLSTWSKTGIEPKDGNQDLRYYLDLEEKRLKSRNVKLKLDIRTMGGIYEIEKALKTFKILNAVGFSRFHTDTFYQHVEKKIEYYRNNKLNYSSKKEVFAYHTLIMPDSKTENIGELMYVCPNCGGISSINELSNSGCPFCSTKFKISEFYPKITNYYFLDNVDSEKNLDSGLKISIILGIIIFSAINFFNYFKSSDQNIIFFIITLLLGAGLGAFLGYFIYSIGLLFGLLGKFFKSSDVIFGSAGQAQNINHIVSKYDENFNYEYFENKLISLAKIVIYSEDLKNSPQYKGNKPDDIFSRVLNIDYSGGMRMDNFKLKDGNLVGDFKLYVNLIIDGRSKIYCKRSAINMRVIHKNEFKVNPGFSIKKVECHNCGGSFDYTKRKTCPFCGSEYQVEYDDWLVTNISLD